MLIYGIVYSKIDPAGIGVSKVLKELLKPRKCRECKGAVECFCGDNYVMACFEEDVIYFDFLDERLPIANKFIVLSRHSSAAKIKSYTVHHTGNPGSEAQYGGKPRSLAVASPYTSYTLLRKLMEYAREAGRADEYSVSYEATHHGPTEVSKPLSFIEIGSSEDEWRDPINHEVLARAVEWVIMKGEAKATPAIGIGGGHYPRKHTKLALEGRFSYGHIFSKHALPYLDEALLEKAINRSDPRPEVVVVEKKGTRREHREIIERFACKYGLKIEYI